MLMRLSVGSINWCGFKRGVSTLPVKPEYLCLYLQHIKEVTGSKAAASEAVNAVSWAHQLAGLPCIADHRLVVTTLAAMQRSLAKPVRKKEPRYVVANSTPVGNCSLPIISVNYSFCNYACVYGIISFWLRKYSPWKKWLANITA